MAAYSNLARPAKRSAFLRTGLCIGLAGGFAEIVVVWLYSSLTGGDAATVAGGVASAIGLHGASPVAGVVVHMSLAVALGIALSAALRIAGWPKRDGAIFSFVVGCLVAVWAINYFLVLPVISPSFLQLVPYAVALASKLAFGFAAATALRVLPAPLLVPQIINCGDGSEAAV